ncbi:MAG: hypothetical protein DRN17_03545 [Thermoplasmata archaeon]|nr:MAG: hypothetical protein DRN17_03545 [Thermoplasmata archaeon]
MLDTVYNDTTELLEDFRRANEPVQKDAISPNHYKLFSNDKRKADELEALDIIKASLTEEEFKGYLKGNQLKYLLRHKNKNGEEDLRKAKRYAEFYENNGVHV